MKSFSVAPLVRLFLVVGGMVALGSSGFAETSDGAVSTQLAKNLYCGTADLLEGDIGLLIGLILVFTGLWSLVQGGKLVAALPVLIFGALVTALPSLIISTLEGLGTLLSENRISSETFEIQQCASGSESSTYTLTDAQKEAIAKAMQDNSGHPYPSQGVYTAPANSSGSPDDRDERNGNN